MLCTRRITRRSLSFYYDNLRSRRPGTTYDLNNGGLDPAWVTDFTNSKVKQVVFDDSFFGASPRSTYHWFYEMRNLGTIIGIYCLNTSEVTRMDGMFYRCYKITSLDLDNFNTAKVTDMSEMFRGCSALETINVGDDWSVNDMAALSKNVFKECPSLVGGQGTAYDANHVDVDYAHIDGGSESPGYFTKKKEAYAEYTSSNQTLTFYYDTIRSSCENITFDMNTGDTAPGWLLSGKSGFVNNVVFDPSFAYARPTSTYQWFMGMQFLTYISGLQYLNTSEVTNMGCMFKHCYDLTSISLRNFNTEKVTNMARMFDDCKKISYIDLSSFNTSNVAHLDSMFYSDGYLQIIYVGSGWNTSAVTSSAGMFEGCSRLAGGQGTAYDPAHVDAAYAHLDGGPDNPGYFTMNHAAKYGNLQLPVEYVTWDECQAFITRLNQITGKNFRFPTEAEWEFAARGGNQSKGYKYAGSNTIDDVAWYYKGGNSDLNTHAVATKAPNELGLYDMSGNVKEWCQDWVGGAYSSEAQTNPTGPSSGQLKLYRGGSWASPANECHVSYRQSIRYYSSYLGLRLAL